jgi:hypothetical protein
MPLANALLKVLGCWRPEDEIKGQEKVLGKGVEQYRHQDHHCHPTIEQECPGRLRPAAGENDEENDGKDQLRRHDIEHVGTDLIARFSPLEPHTTDRAAELHPEPVLEERSAAAIGTAEPECSPEQGDGASPGAFHAPM